MRKNLQAVYRVLVVDDFDGWRSHVRRTLTSKSEWQIVGEAIDGPQAVQAAAELEPDLILLDIGLPTLNGIKVASRVLAANPAQRILFVSEHRSLTHEALATGALGYIIKSEAGRELLPAMDAVVHGRRYVGTGAEMPERDTDRPVHAPFGTTPLPEVI